MEKAAKTRSRAKAAALPLAPSDIDNRKEEKEEELVLNPAPPDDGGVKKRKTKKKKPVVEAESQPTEPQPESETAAEEQTTSKRAVGRRVKAKDIVSDIENNRMSAVTQEDEPFEEEEEEKTKQKAKKETAGKKKSRKVPRKKKEETEMVVETVAVEVEENKENNEETKEEKTMKKRRGRKAAAKEAINEEQTTQQEVVAAVEKTPKHTVSVENNDNAVTKTPYVTSSVSNEEAKTPKTNTEVVAAVAAVISTTTTRSRARTRTTNNEVESMRQAALPQIEPTAEVSVPTESQSTAQQPSNTTETTAAAPSSVKKPKIGGGARIVRPKETIAVIKTVVSESNANGGVVEVEKKVVEIVKREAGPRIVKPPEAILQEQQLAAKRKQQNEELLKAKKLKERAESVQKKTITATTTSSTSSVDSKKETAPDFKSIHQKEASKMESIIDFQKRLHQRHMSMNSETRIAAPTTLANKPLGAVTAAAAATGRSPSVSAVSRIASGLPKPNIAAPKENNENNANNNPVAAKVKRTATFTASSTPKANNVLGAQSSNIPVFMSKAQPKDQKTPKALTTTKGRTNTETGGENLNPKTPSNQVVKTTKPAQQQQQPKTPANQVQKPTGVESSAVKRSAQKFSQYLPKQQSQENAVPSIPPQLATSSFIRRKSFDLNASLSRRLGYKPYIGKLKPIEPPVVKPSVSNTALSTTKANLNTTRNN